MKAVMNSKAMVFTILAAFAITIFAVPSTASAGWTPESPKKIEESNNLANGLLVAGCALALGVVIYAAIKSGDDDEPKGNDVPDEDNDAEESSSLLKPKDSGLASAISYTRPVKARTSLGLYFDVDPGSGDPFGTQSNLDLSATTFKVGLSFGF